MKKQKIMETAAIAVLAAIIVCFFVRSAPVSKYGSEVELNLISYTLSTNYDGSTLLIATYKITNKSSHDISFAGVCNQKAYQDNKECDGLVISDLLDKSCENKLIRPNASYQLSVGYELRTPHRDVHIKITNITDNNIVYFDEIISIKK